MSAKARLGNALGAVHFERLAVDADGRPVICHMGGSFVTVGVRISLGAFLEYRAPELGSPSVDGDGSVDALKAEADRLDELAARGYVNERLDQLLVDVLMGLR